MRRSHDLSSGERRLRWLLGLFFVALVIPSAWLAWQAYSRLQWENLHRFQLMAEDLRSDIDRRLGAAIAREQRRAFADYQFSVLEGAPTARYRRRSPLAAYPVDSDIPGLVGYFQVDAQGRFTTPLLPDGALSSSEGHGIGDEELRQRSALRAELLRILGQQGPAAAAIDDASERGSSVAADASAASPPAREPVADKTGPTAFSSDTPRIAADQAVARMAKEQALAREAFDRLSEDRLLRRESTRPKTARKITPSEDLESGQTTADERIAAHATPANTVIDPQRRSTADQKPTLVQMFQGEIDPFEFARLGDAHFVLYRRVWRDGQRYIQGAVVERAALLQTWVESAYRDTALAGMSHLSVAFDDDILLDAGGAQGARYLASDAELSGTLLYRGRLSSPLDRLELIFTVTRMPSGSAGGFIVWVALALSAVLSVGMLAIYRLGHRQLVINQQQRDFVSAVSHELKTPLTSIRMYSEILREGWVDEQRRRDYYDFIHDESERLSRLIANVLQFARMSRDELKVDPQPLAVDRLMALVQSKVATQVRQAGFELKVDYDDVVANQRVAVDEDAFTQIMINLVDNAIKFSAKAERRLIQIAAHAQPDRRIAFTVRDHGPGIPRDQMNKIFRLFYRSENELTRETVGSGIGLALVNRLTSAMGGDVDVINRQPGAEFRVRMNTA